MQTGKCSLGFGACRLISMGWIFQGSQGSVCVCVGGAQGTQEAPGDSQPAAFQADL